MVWTVQLTYQPSLMGVGDFFQVVKKIVLGV